MIDRQRSGKTPSKLTHEQARKGLAAAIADARRQNLPMAVAIVDTAGRLVAFER